MCATLALIECDVAAYGGCALLSRCRQPRSVFLVVADWSRRRDGGSQRQRQRRYRRSPTSPSTRTGVSCRTERHPRC